MAYKSGTFNIAGDQKQPGFYTNIEAVKQLDGPPQLSGRVAMVAYPIYRRGGGTSANPKIIKVDTPSINDVFSQYVFRDHDILRQTVSEVLKNATGVNLIPINAEKNTDPTKLLKTGKNAHGMDFEGHYRITDFKLNGGDWDDETTGTKGMFYRTEINGARLFLTRATDGLLSVQFISREGTNYTSVHPDKSTVMLVSAQDNQPIYLTSTKLDDPYKCKLVLNDSSDDVHTRNREYTFNLYYLVPVNAQPHELVLGGAMMRWSSLLLSENDGDAEPIDASYPRCIIPGGAGVNPSNMTGGDMKGCSMLYLTAESNYQRDGFFVLSISSSAGTGTVSLHYLDFSNNKLINTEIGKAVVTGEQDTRQALKRALNALNDKIQNDGYAIVIKDGIDLSVPYPVPQLQVPEIKRLSGISQSLAAGGTMKVSVQYNIPAGQEDGILYSIQMGVTAGDDIQHLFDLPDPILIESSKYTGKNNVVTFNQIDVSEEAAAEETIRALVQAHKNITLIVDLVKQEEKEEPVLVSRWNYVIGPTSQPEPQKVVVPVPESRRTGEYTNHQVQSTPVFPEKTIVFVLSSYQDPCLGPDIRNVVKEAITTEPTDILYVYDWKYYYETSNEEPNYQDIVEAWVQFAIDNFDATLTQLVIDYDLVSRKDLENDNTEELNPPASHPAIIALHSNQSWDSEIIGGWVAGMCAGCSPSGSLTAQTYGATVPYTQIPDQPTVEKWYNNRFMSFHKDLGNTMIYVDRNAYDGKQAAGGKEFSVPMQRNQGVRIESSILRQLRSYFLTTILGKLSVTESSINSIHSEVIRILDDLTARGAIQKVNPDTIIIQEKKNVDGIPAVYVEFAVTITLTAEQMYIKGRL